MNGSQPWRLAAAAMALVLVTSTVIAVIAWTTSEVEFRVETPAGPEATKSVRMAVVAPQASAMAVPPPYAIAACNRQAGRSLTDEGQVEALKAGVLGSGTLYGLDQKQRSDDRYRDAYARCMRSRGYSR